MPLCAALLFLYVRPLPADTVSRRISYGLKASMVRKISAKSFHQPVIS
jgi:hypothetical protein